MLYGLFGFTLDGGIEILSGFFPKWVGHFTSVKVDSLSVWSLRMFYVVLAHSHNLWIIQDALSLPGICSNFVYYISCVNYFLWMWTIFKCSEGLTESFGSCKHQKFDFTALSGLRYTAAAVRLLGSVCCLLGHCFLIFIYYCSLKDRFYAPYNFLLL